MVEFPAWVNENYEKCQLAKERLRITIEADEQVREAEKLEQEKTWKGIVIGLSVIVLVSSLAAVMQ